MTRPTPGRAGFLSTSRPRRHLRARGLLRHRPLRQQRVGGERAPRGGRVVVCYFSAGSSGTGAGPRAPARPSASLDGTARQALGRCARRRRPPRDAGPHGPRAVAMGCDGAIDPTTSTATPTPAAGLTASTSSPTTAGSPPGPRPRPRRRPPERRRPDRLARLRTTSHFAVRQLLRGAARCDQVAASHPRQQGVLNIEYGPVARPRAHRLLARVGMRFHRSSSAADRLDGNYALWSLTRRCAARARPRSRLS